MPGIKGRGTPNDITLEAAVDLSNYQFTFVGFAAGDASGTPQARVTTATSGANRFILQNKPSQYKGAVVRLVGTTGLKVGEACAVGAFLKPGSGGKGYRCAATEPYSAIAMEAATADGDIIEALVQWGVTPSGSGLAVSASPSASPSTSPSASKSPSSSTSPSVSPS